MTDDKGKKVAAKIEESILNEIAEIEFRRRPQGPGRTWKHTPPADYLRDAWELRKVVLDPKNALICEACRERIAGRLPTIKTELTDSGLSTEKMDSADRSTGTSSGLVLKKEQSAVETLAELLSQILVERKIESESRSRIQDAPTQTPIDKQRAVEQLCQAIRAAQAGPSRPRKTGTGVASRRR